MAITGRHYSLRVCGDRGRQRRPGGGRPSRWWAGACAGREEIASVLVVVEKTPAHCVSVTWSTLGRQPRARGDSPAKLHALCGGHHVLRKRK